MVFLAKEKKKNRKPSHAAPQASFQFRGPRSLTPLSLTTGSWPIDVRGTALRHHRHPSPPHSSSFTAMALNRNCALTTQAAGASARERASLPEASIKTHSNMQATDCFRNLELIGPLHKKSAQPWRRATAETCAGLRQASTKRLGCIWHCSKYCTSSARRQKPWFLSVASGWHQAVPGVAQ